ncbi:DHHA1 domain-containing protein [Bacillus sp. 31A1R]|uniref:DHHA1 domain-containing protein n=1 Tax=Robertmurraya mangrovi TaxID=3098077 RepID=A0ABU5J509_9BACI|nr:DHHA1 domain-containing protein [Bacillus sp. 31A1R]MDZ5474510.1 DHHA1 domain-containing protein [Bacillus sp. 31A1R]
MYQLFTHNDLDGVGCGIVAKIAFKDQVEVSYNSVMGLNHQVARYLERANDKRNKDKFVFITDLSINEENTKRVDEFVKNRGRLKLIDHHKTALHFNDYSWGSVRVEYDDGRLACATSLFYEYLIQHRLIEPTPALHEFVELVRQYDTWEWDENDNITAKHLNDLFFMGSIEDFEEKMVARIQKSRHFEFDEFEKKLLEMEEEKIERYIRRKKREIVQTFIGDYCAGIVHAENYHSELGNELGKENEHLDYIAILNLGGKKISFRTIHDHVDVSAIADLYGGGGHAKAAGCSINEEAYELYVKGAFITEPMRQDAFRNHFNLKNTPQGSLYENRKEDKFFIYMTGEHHWVVEENGERHEQIFDSFREAEKYVKRNHAAWLTRDDHFVDYLRDFMMKMKTDESLENTEH